MTSQSQTASRIKAVGRIIMVAALVCTLLLGANFALTVTAVVSNKDVYVNTNSKSLVDPNGEKISVDVTETITSAFDVPYQHMRAIANTQVITVPNGEDTLILKPSMFQYAKVQQHGYELSMKTADGTTLTWGPPTKFGSDGVLMKLAVGEKSISITTADGKKTKVTAGEGRRLPDYMSAASSWGGDYKGHDIDIGCARNIHGTSTWTTHQQQVYGYTPDTGTAPWPLAIYLAGTNSAMHNSMADMQVHAMKDLGWVAVQIEYDDQSFKWICGDPDVGSGWRGAAKEVADCLDEICAHETSYIGCGSGVAVYGWSQGGILSLFVGFANAKVTAVLSFDGTILNSDGRWDRWHHTTNAAVMETCFTDHQTPGNTRNRIIVAAKDGYMGGDGSVNAHPPVYGTGDPADNAANAATASGHSCKAADGSDEMTCLDSYGAGYVVVTEADSKISFLGHWWFADADENGLFTGWNAKFKKGKGEWGKAKTFGFLDTRGKQTGGH